jgi:hypothetical protein
VAALYALHWDGDSRLAGAQRSAASMALALESTPSGKSADVVLDGLESGRLKLESSFEHVDGRYCRQYELSFATSGRGFIGYACRVGDVRWRIEKEFAKAIEQKPEVPTGKDDAPRTLKPANADPSLKALDDLINAIARGDNLLLDKEQTLIGNGWRSDGN